MNAIASPPLTARAAVPRRIDWVAIAIFGLVWLELISRLRFEWTINPQYGYGWSVPFLAGYIFWRRAETRPEPSPPITKFAPAATMLMAAALFIPLRFIQEANPDWRILSWTMALSAIAITCAGLYLSGGLRWLGHYIFPLLFFLVAVPWPTQFEQTVIQGLMRAVASINVEVLNTIGISAVQMGNIIEVGSGFVGIDEACTGVRSLQATLAVSLFLGEFYGFSWLRRGILLVAGAALAFVSNLVRTFFLVWVAEREGAQAIKVWHDPAGLTILTACLFGLWGLSMYMGGASTFASGAASGRSAFRIPRLLLGALLALVLTAEAGTQLWYGVHEARGPRAEPWTVAWPTGAANWKSIEVAEQAKDLLGYNQGGGGNWSGGDGHNWTMYFFSWMPGRTAGLFVKNHRPDICLPASGMTLRGSAQHKLLTINGINLPIRSYVFENGASTLHVYYCYWDGPAPAGQAINQENWTASGRLEAVRRGKRDRGTQMLEIIAWGYEDADEAERALRQQLGPIVRRG